MTQRSGESDARVGPANVAGGPLVAATRLQALRDSPGAFQDCYADFAAHDATTWRMLVEQWTRPPDSTSILAIHGATCIGMCGAQRESAERALLVSMWVAPAWRGTRVAARLVDAVQAFASSLGASVIAAWVVADNHRALHFYRKMGFEPDGTRRPYTPRPDIEECLLVRAVVPR